MLKIDQALTDDFITQVAGALPIAHVNADYKPKPGVPYFEVRVLQNEVLPEDMASEDSTTGLMQFIVRRAEGEGAIPARLDAETIFKGYPIGRRIVFDGLTVEVTGRANPEAVPEDGWFKVVGQILYRARVPRT